MPANGRWDLIRRLKVKNVVSLDVCVPALDEGNTFRRGTGIHLPSEYSKRTVIFVLNTSYA